MSELSGINSDCERITDGILSQPTNTFSSLGFVVAGVLVLVAIRRRTEAGTNPAGPMAGMLILTGLGSAAFHGFGGSFATWLHDASLAGLLVLLLFFEIIRRTRRRWTTAPWVVAFAGSAALFSLFPEAAPPVSAAVAFGALVLALTPDRWSRPGSWAAVEKERWKSLRLPLALLAGGAVLYLLSRSGGPLCDPDSVLQGHGLWHILSAAGLALYAARTGRADPALTDL